MLTFKLMTWLRGGVARPTEHAPVFWLRPSRQNSAMKWNAQKSEAQRENGIFFFAMFIFVCKTIFFCSILYFILQNFILLHIYVALNWLHTLQFITEKTSKYSIQYISINHILVYIRFVNPCYVQCFPINIVIPCLHWRNWILSKAVKDEQLELLKYNGMHLVKIHLKTGSYNKNSVVVLKCEGCKRVITHEQVWRG